MDHNAKMPQDHSIPRIALLLGWLGVVPFVALGLATVIADQQAAASASSALVLYAAVILSFMGGAQWGLAMVTGVNEPPVLARRLAISVLPALAAFALAILPARAALTGLAAVFLALLAYDIATARAGIAPAWYPALRIQLTTAVVFCLLVAVGLGRA
jgi:Protein of unknown function (DUF3429)